MNKKKKEDGVECLEVLLGKYDRYKVIEDQDSRGNDLEGQELRVKG
jgi:hypothetical protein